MKPDINPRVGYQNGPGKYQNGINVIFKEFSRNYSEGKCVGCMGREESVCPATVVNIVNHTSQNRILRGAKTLHGFFNQSRKLIANNNRKTNQNEDIYRILFVGFNDEVNNQQIERNPDFDAGKNGDGLVPEIIVEAVQKQQ